VTSPAPGAPRPGRDVAGRTAVVTGGGHGLGRVMALALARAGAAVVVPDISPEHLRALLAEEPAIIGVRADVAEEADVRRVVDTAIGETGRLDVVVNNAGISPAAIRADAATNPVLFWELTGEEFRRFLGVHTVAPLLMASAALPHMRARDWGRIVNVTTSHVTMLGRGRAAYGPPKAASEALVAVMAHDLEGSGVTANVLIPGGAAATHPEREGTSARNLIDPEVMGPPAVFLASSDADGITARRFQACLWDPDRSDAQNVASSAAPVAWPAAPTRPGA